MALARVRNIWYAAFVTMRKFCGVSGTRTEMNKLLGKLKVKVNHLTTFLFMSQFLPACLMRSELEVCNDSSLKRLQIVLCAYSDMTDLCQYYSVSVWLWKCLNFELHVNVRLREIFLERKHCTNTWRLATNRGTQHCPTLNMPMF